MARLLKAVDKVLIFRRPMGGLNSRPQQKWQKQLLNDQKGNVPATRLEPRTFRVQNTHSGTELQRQLGYCQLFWYLIRIWNDRWYHKICLWKDGLASAKGHYISKSREKKLKINFLRIWSLDFSSYTSDDFLIAKERTPHSQKCARILIDSKSIPDSVFWNPTIFA